MAKFLTGNELNAELEKMFEQAREQLILISPFIKLHDRYISVLKAKQHDPDFQMIIIFGKNEDDFSRSMKQEDFDFFKEFPNIEIRYEKRLHAKYYANESSAIITSMNLYSYSQDNNIEAGVMTEATLWNNGNSLDGTTWKYFERVIEQADLLFLKKPQYEKGVLGIGRKYIQSVVETDKLSDFFANKTKFEVKSIERKQLSKEKTPVTGYCIRTGKQIPFNPKSPMSKEAYQSWAKYKDENYKEKYCHFSGEESRGETTFAKPILKKNWRKANGL